MKKDDFVIIIVATCIALALGFVIHSLVEHGYKKGQLDYARNKIEYTIDGEGRTIHYLNK